MRFDRIRLQSNLPYSWTPGTVDQPVWDAGMAGLDFQHRGLPWYGNVCHCCFCFVYVTYI